jgi:hypothetical protein
VTTSCQQRIPLRYYQWPAVPGVLGDRELAMTVTALSGGETPIVYACPLLTDPRLVTMTFRAATGGRSSPS